ncbi:MAG: TraB/GumN family protein [Candidatus Binatia bacterium]
MLIATPLAGAREPAPKGGSAAKAMAPPSTPERPPYLWRIEGGGKPSYLFGTVHVGLDLESVLQKEGCDALDHATRVFVELDLTSGMTFEAAIRTLLTRSQMGPGQSLRALLTPAAWDRLVTMHKNQLSPEMLDQFEPWFAALVTHRRLSEAGRKSAEATQRRLAQRPALDYAIAARAKAHGIRVEALETPLQQVQVFNAAGPAMGLKMLREQLADGRSADDQITPLIDAYGAGDDRHLAKEFGRFIRRRRELAERIAYQRNQLWVEHLALWLPDGGMFVATGVFHMFGDRGLVALLRQRGYRVERVSVSAPSADPAPVSR